MALIDFQREYTRVFSNARPEVPAPPYRSLYFLNREMTCGETTMELYGDAGLKVAEDFKYIPDHFAAELEYMSYLIQEEIKKGEDYRPGNSSLRKNSGFRKMLYGINEI
jgi:TorA maturation chaperone TorD